MRRAWWSLLALAAIFAFCLCAEWVCPCDPRAVVDPATLERYRRPTVERVYDVKAARFSVGADGEVYDYEGPAELLDACRARAKAGGDFALDGYRARVTKRDGYRRVFLEPSLPPTVKEVVGPLAAVSYPFRPVKEHPFGIDAGGRDVYARVLFF